MLFMLAACGQEIDHVDLVQGPKGDTGTQGERGLDGTNGVDGTDGVDGVDGTNGTNGIDAVSQVTTVSFTNTTACKEIINESGLVVFGNKASNNTDTVRIYFSSNCTGNSESLSYTSNETMMIGRNLIIISGRNNGNPQPLVITRVKL